MVRVSSLPTCRPLDFTPLIYACILRTTLPFPQQQCSFLVEDIDFEFVYALHNFVATVDGQANAAKGDTMVLLDDSNSYWWLVRIVKDGSIGESTIYD